MGTPHAQVVGTYGERCISGSNLNTYADWNANKEHFGDHNTAAHDPAFFPADPVSAEETAMLTSTPDLTPSCSRSCFWCSDTAGSHPGEPGEILRNLDANGWPDYILQGAYAGQWPLVADPNLLANATARGVKVISIIDVYNDADGSQSRPVSYIDVTETYERLAAFLGATEDLSSEKREFCAEMNNFKATAAAAATRGVRAMGVFAPYVSVAGGVTNGFLYGAITDQVSFMLEELGMQILHNNSGYAPLDAATLGKQYPIDFWLYDVRVTLDFISDTFSTAWPHPALVADQYARYPNGGHIHSYEHGTEILKHVGEALGKAQRIEPTTPCTEVADVTDVHYRTVGLGRGQYACPKPVEYDWCVNYASVDSAYLARPGVAVAAGAAVAALL